MGEGTRDTDACSGRLGVCGGHPALASTGEGKTPVEPLPPGAGRECVTTARGEGVGGRRRRRKKIEVGETELRKPQGLLDSGGCGGLLVWWAVGASSGVVGFF